MYSEDALFNAAKNDPNSGNVYTASGYASNGNYTQGEYEKSRTSSYDAEKRQLTIKIKYACDCGCPGKPPCGTDGKDLLESFLFGLKTISWLVSETGSRIDDALFGGAIKEGDYILLGTAVITSRIPGIKAPVVTGWVKKKIFRSLDKAVQKKIIKAIEKGIVPPEGNSGIISLTKSEIAELKKQTGNIYSHKIKDAGKDLRIYGKIQENNHIYFDKAMGH